MHFSGTNTGTFGPLLLYDYQQAADRLADVIVTANDGQEWRELRIVILNSGWRGSIVVRL